MTNVMQQYNDFINDLSKSFIGFDKFIQNFDGLKNYDLTKTPGFPHYNIKKKDDNTYIIELGVAGFSKDEIEVTVKDDILTITGNHVDEEKDYNSEYLYRGLAGRAFTKMFPLASNSNNKFEVKNAELVNGILKIMLEYNKQLSDNVKHIEVK